MAIRYGLCRLLRTAYQLHWVRGSVTPVVLEANDLGGRIERLMMQFSFVARYLCVLESSDVHE
jgi:hypothetical protein